MIKFTHSYYRKLLEYIKSLRYPISSFRDVPASGPQVILRHDVDFSLKKAKEMALIDHEMGVTSTFFVLLDSPYYNPLCKDNIKIIKEIAQLGHEIGLHYDTTGFDTLSSEKRRGRVCTLARCLGDYLDSNISALAQHKPATSGIKEDFPGFVDAYSESFCNQKSYISDSRQRFWVQDQMLKNKDLYAFFKEKRRIQLLIHPIWWFPKEKSREEIFAWVVKQVLTEVPEVLDLLISELKEIEKA